MSKQNQSLPTRPKLGRKQAMADASGYKLEPDSTVLPMPAWQKTAAFSSLSVERSLLATVPERVLLARLLLAIAPKEKAIDALVESLLAQFGSLAGVVSAPKHALDAILGEGAVLSVYLQLVNDAARRMHLARLQVGSTLADRAQLMAYLHTVMGQEAIEQVRVLFLDKKHHLLADEVTGRGTIDHAPVYPREVVRRALVLHAHYLVLVHNHPSGDPSPSAADIDMTHRIAQAAKVMGLCVWDHIIIGGGRMVSLREEGFL